MKILNTLIIIITASILLISCQNREPVQETPEIINGVLDLSNWDFEKDGTVKLNGNWEFYWKQLLEPNDFKQKVQPVKTGYFDIPGSWNDYEIDQKKISGTGYGTFRLIVKVKNEESIYGLKMLHMATAYQMWIDDAILLSNGKVGKSYETMVPQYLPKISMFSPQDKTIQIVLQVSNFYHRKGGPWEVIEFGRGDQIIKKREFRINFELFLFGALLIMAIYHFGLYIFRRKDKSTLYFGFVCLAIIGRVLIHGERFLISIFPNINWEFALKIEYICFYMFIPLFMMFFEKLFPLEFSKILLRISQWLGFVFIMFVAVMPASINSYSIPFYQIITVVFGIYLHYVLIKAIIKKREGAFLLLTGGVFFFLAYINDILVANEFYYSIHLVPLGLFVFITSQSIILSKRFSNAFSTVEIQSDQLKINEKELKAKNEALLNSSKIKDMFLANTSHELRTPLNGIIGLAESLRDGIAGVLPDKADVNLSMIIHSGRRLANLVNDILDFSKMKNQDLELHLKPVELKSSVEVVLALFEPIMGEKPIKLLNKISDDIALVIADENRLQQILVNLIGNAIKFTHQGEVCIAAEVKDSYIIIAIEDSGIGIPQENQVQIFESFEQVDASTSRIHGGTGLGLAITKILIELHDGSIRVESEVGKGSTFFFTLPIANEESLEKNNAAVFESSMDSKSLQNNNITDRGILPSHSLKLLASMEIDDQESDTSDNQKEVLPESMEDVKVLVVDDDPVNIQVIINYLKIAGYDPAVAYSGFDALEMLKNTNPDIILLDIMMPKMTGFEAAKKIRENHSQEELPIIFLTAKNQMNDLVDGFTSGGSDYITKPFSKNELLMRIKSHVTLKKAIEESKKLLTIEKELDVARKIQMSTIPDGVPKISDIDIAAKYVPMQSMGGDFYSFHDIDDEGVAVFLSDVSGHGIPAALVTSMIKIVFLMLKDIAHKPSEFLQNMNSIFLGNTESLFFTALHFYIDIKKSKLYLGRAGHEPLLLHRRSENKIYEYAPGGRLIGYFENNQIKTEEISLIAGDRIIAYTDGITEACQKNNDMDTQNDRIMFGDAAFKNFILENGDLSSNEFISQLLDTIRNWTGESESFDDDVTIVVVDV